MKKLSIAVFIITVFILAACGKGSTPTTIATSPPSEGETPTKESVVLPTVAQPTDVPSSTQALPIEPQDVTFQAADGQELHGYYYPAATNPAPLVVLMHWVNGDMSDWYEIAPWLQHRGLVNPFPTPGGFEWWDPSWFPTMPEGRSYGVFIFSFRGCSPMSDRGCTSIEEAGWLLDAQAAMVTATTLEGADPRKIVAIGSSIGADGAIDGCVYLNEQQPGACQGALSLSPGGYLTIPYTEAVKSLGENQPPVAAWCLADENEISFCNAAASSNTKFNGVEIPSGQHGNMLLRPNLTPLPMQLILDFLFQTTGQ